jgi:spore coat polysaccharide biosynthesis predicted glycosyltransferase SpsG
MIFRADAAKALGSGHVMRCSAIAEEAMSRGIECLLVGQISEMGWVQSHLRDIGLKHHHNPSTFIPDSKGRDLLIVDSYTLDAADFFLSPNKWNSITSIADSETPNFKSNLIFHPGFNADWFSGDKANLYFGPEYVPLRKMIKKKPQRSNEEVAKIVIFGGGVDAFGMGFEIARGLATISNFSEAVIYSREANAIQKIDPRFKVLPFGKSLDIELNDADLVITTASTSSMEIIAREIPLAVLSSVHNQNAYYKEIEKLKLAACIGTKSFDGSWDLDSEELNKVVTDRNYRFNILKNMRNVIDLRGSERIVDRILEHSL